MTQQPGSNGKHAEAVRVIVNADDLGMNDRINAAIFGMLRAGRLTSATIMANAPGTDEAVRELRHYPNASFGVHLNVIDFAPLSPTPGLQPLLGPDGQFRNVIEKATWSASLLTAIARELSAQIEHLLAGGVHLSHIDSHHHTHTLPAMFPVLKFLQVKFGIRKVRLTRNYYESGKSPSPALLRKKRLFNTALARAYRTRTTDGFMDLFTFIDNARAGLLRGSVFEIMVHPGADEREDAKLLSPWEREVPFPLEFMSYRDL
jgi:predicted glycoside hydrolase/deacetylase ChbG (UPF0249 family)